MATKTVKVYFYMETGNSIFVQKIPGNTARNTVLWRSVLSVCHGVWLNDKQWKFFLYIHAAYCLNYGCHFTYYFIMSLKIFLKPKVKLFV